MSGGAARVLALAESCPELAADARFQELREKLREAENRIAAARRRTNDAVLRYNTAISTVPAKLVAARSGCAAGSASRSSRRLDLRSGA